jgi:Zn-dependent protease with chaperone function
VDRDEVAELLIVLLSGALIWLFGALVPTPPDAGERVAWRRLWLPALPASLPLFVLLGFAVADPEGPQGLNVTRLIAAVPFGLVWLRAGVRAVLAVFAEVEGPALTVGLFRPTVKLSAELLAMLRPGELRAVMAHEEAHVRHCDPRWIWIVQLLTDLQWPFSRPRLRQRAWLAALELARDDEAVQDPNVDAADLASALVKAASLAQGRTRAGAALADDATLLEIRVRRLLSPPAPHPEGRRSFLAPFAVSLAIAAFVFGVVASAPYVAILAGSP